MKAKHDDKLHFRMGGNPPVHAGIFTDEGQHVAWWPAGYNPDAHLASVIYEMWMARGEGAAISRDEVRDLIEHPGGQ